MDGRQFESFAGVSCDDPLNFFDKKIFKDWIEKHKNNIVMHYPTSKNQNSLQTELTT